MRHLAAIVAAALCASQALGQVVSPADQRLIDDVNR